MSGFFLANPVGLWGLAAALAVAVMYLFYRRYKPLPVTGLFLWGAPARDGGGGRRLQPPILGRSLLFDLLAALFIGMSLAGPAWRVADGRPLVIVLDDSFGMRSRDADAEAREQARALLGRLRSRDRAAVILAGVRARQLSGMETPPREAAAMLDAYHPAAPSGNLRQAVALAGRMYGGGLDIHVFSNQDAAVGATSGSRVFTHTLAGRGGNLAFGRLWRMPMEDGAGERVVLSVANYSARAARVVVTLDEPGIPVPLHRATVELAPGGEKYVETVVTGAEDAVLRLELSGDGEDAIREDSIALLAPLPSAPVTYRMEGLDADAARYFRLALEAAGCAAAPAPGDDGIETADLLITHGSEAKGRALTLVVNAPTNPGVFNPPLVVDSASRLCRDVQLAGQPWVIADRAAPEAVSEIFVMAGDTPLFWRSRPDRLHLNLVPGRGTLARTPAWPALIANLAAETAALRPGLEKALYMPGERLRFRSVEPVSLIDGDGKTVAPAARRDMALPLEAGVYTLRRGDADAGQVSVLPLYGDAADTSGLAEQAGETVSGTVAETGGVLDLTWLSLLLGIGFLGLNWALGLRRKV